LGCGRLLSGFAGTRFRVWLALRRRFSLDKRTTEILRFAQNDDLKTNGAADEAASLSLRDIF
jgi:hypothetical protein